jgi:tetratricopeptide (TPR) repeat protein
MENYTGMDARNAVISLCMRGARAEFEGRANDAHEIYRQAWDISKDDYEACIAAHYMARFQPTPEETLWWNQQALECANRVNDDRVKEFYPSLYLNLGHSYEKLGNQDEAKRYYDLAAQLGAMHQPD